ncbi:tetratricopeptide repeat protein [Acidiphilium sp.]|uniref:tetratricopeptide repeat protein n=1 Tax=Acidiphilium sp. TaxID=527 RepID=UPI003D01E9DF
MPAVSDTLDQPTVSQKSPPDFSATLIQRVRSLIGRGQINAATLLLPTLQKLCPNSDDVALIKVEIALARGNVAEATATIDRGLADLPQSAPLLLLRARLNFQNRDMVGAAIAAADAVIADHTNAPAKSLLGQALLELGQTEQAAICLREAMAKMPGDMPTLNALTRAAPADAEVMIREAIASGHDDVRMRNALVGVLLKRGDSAGADIEIRNLTVRGEADAQTEILAIQSAIESGHWSEAAALFHKSTAHLPRHA